VTSAIGLITERVRERVRSEGVDLAGDEALAARLVRDEVQRYSEHALGGSHPLLSDEAPSRARSSPRSPGSARSSRSSTTRALRNYGSTDPTVSSLRGRAFRSGSTWG